MLRPDSFRNCQFHIWCLHQDLHASAPGTTGWCNLCTPNSTPPLGNFLACCFCPNLLRYILLMEGRKSSKKTRSYGGAPRSSRTSPNPLPSQSSAPRPQYKERVRSAPLGVPQLEERQQQQTGHQTCADNVSRGNQTSEPVPWSSGPFFTPVSRDSSVLSQPHGNNIHVKMP